MSPPDPLAVAVTVLAVLVAALLGRRLSSLDAAGRRAGVAVWVWLAAALALSVLGFFPDPRAFARSDLVGMALFGTLMALPLAAFALAWRRSAAWRSMVGALPTWWLVALQVYRLGGAVFAALAWRGDVPAAFGWTTAAFDVAVGAAALPLAFALRAGRSWAVPATLAWCGMGLADFAFAIGSVNLAFVATLAGAAVADPAPAMIGRHPLALISLFLVPLAIIGHVLVASRLLRERRHPAAAPVSA